MTNFISFHLCNFQARRPLLRLGCSCLCLLTAMTAQAMPAPFWIDAHTQAGAGRIVGGSGGMHSLLGVGDTVLAQWPASRTEPAGAAGTHAPGAAIAPESTCATQTDAAGEGTARYRILRVLPASAGQLRTSAAAATAQGILVQPVGTATLAAAPDSTQSADAPQALLAIAQAADAIRPGDLLLPLDSSAPARDTARPPSLPCSHP